MNVFKRAVETTTPLLLGTPLPLVLPHQMLHRRRAIPEAVLIIPAGNGAKTTVGTAQGYLVQLCLFYKSPPVASLVIHPCQTARELSTPPTKTRSNTKNIYTKKRGRVGKFASKSQDILCFRVALAELPRIGQLLLWPSPSWILWQREARGGGHLCVALQVRDQSHGIPWKKKSECVTPVMSPKLLSIKQAEMGIQGQQRAVPEDYLPNMVVWLLPADEFPLQFYIAQVWKM